VEVNRWTFEHHESNASSFPFSDFWLSRVNNRTIKKFLPFFALFSLIFFTPIVAYGQAEIPLTSESGADYRYGQIMRFRLSAESEVPVKKITLFVRAPELPNTLTTEVAVDSGKEVQIEQTLDLTQYHLAPFTTVTYWWLVEDEEGNAYTLSEDQIDYVDDQYAWEQLEKDGVQVFWTGDDANVGQAAMDAIVDALPDQQSYIPFEPPDPLRVYVYPSADDLRAALRLTGRDWVGGHAHPELGVILVSATNPKTAEIELEKTIPHELSHMLLYEATGANYGSIPIWFDEGLATLFEEATNGDYETILDEAVRTSNTIPFAELCQAFPEESDKALLAYAQSSSFIRYIQAEYGNFAILQMIRALADGANCQSVTTRAIDRSLEDLNQEWLDDLSPQTFPERLWQQGGIWLVAVLVGFFLMSLFFFGLPRSKS
jgi:hypothetical protein